ncbi:phosphatase PAP2 family protein [Catenulispora sp. NF23]|uniref:phosphatase PAP2 family protein n=1 Tax=Catenulispora pinistramenti TaxID=2705254 RepID=UPI001BA731F0|nr:phosphatase PAP2 family protein [Catenulispora pinistramenti]MBS2534615.1 phosphatase PAP2 family protein [Catenulispora pinistramenti]
MTTTQPLESTAEAATQRGPVGPTGPEDSAGTETGRKRRSWIPGPILPQRFRPTNRPKLWLEIALIALGYYLYTLTRLAAPSHATAAQQRGHDILHLEHYLGLNFEHTFNHWVYSVRWLAFSMNVYYATLHFIVPIVLLVWVYFKFPDRYRAVRTVMIAMTLIALFGFYFYSLAPPRLLQGGNFVDTFKLLNPWGQPASTSDGVAGLGSSTNEYAAMPSLHIGWSTWCALVIAHLAQRKWVKALGIAYPLCTFAVIIGTANHYVLDAVFGLVTLGLGFLVQRIVQGRKVFAAPPAPAGDAPQPQQPPQADTTAAEKPDNGSSTSAEPARPSIHPRM